MSRHLSISIFWMMWAFFATSYITAWASPMGKADGSAHRVKNNLSRAVVRERKTLGGLYTINKAIREMVSRQSRLEERIISLHADIDKLDLVLLALEARKSQLEKALKINLRSLYMMQGQGVARLIFSSKSPAELDRGLKYLEKLSAHNMKLVTDLRRSEKTIAVRLRRREKRLSSLASSKLRFKNSEKNLLSQRNKKGRLLAVIRLKKSKHRSQLDQIRADQLEKGPIDPNEISFFERKGEFSWPVEGRIVQGYGQIKALRKGLKVAHKGWKIRPASTVKVRAIHQGVVALARNLNHRRGTVIIDHGDHYYSVYSGLSKILLNQGDMVSAGDKLGVVGGRLGSKKTFSALYFELRNFSDALNPSSWLISRTDALTSRMSLEE